MIHIQAMVWCMQGLRSASRKERPVQRGGNIRSDPEPQTSNISSILLDGHCAEAMLTTTKSMDETPAGGLPSLF